jgi:two-component system response regulator
MSNERGEVLLVEDNPYDAELTMDALDQSPLASRVHLVRDGVEALAYLFGTGAPTDRDPVVKPAVILLDLKLPRVDGLEVLRQVKTDPRTRTIPVVVLTSSREERDVVESYELGVNSYIVKPVDSEQFTEAVRQMGLYWVTRNEPPPR